MIFFIFFFCRKVTPCLTRFKNPRARTKGETMEVKTMGWTRYWYRKDAVHDPRKWALFVRDATKILEGAKVPLVWKANADVVRIDGGDNYVHETLYIPRDLFANEDESFRAFQESIRAEQGAYFGFCKTNQKPYDPYVARILQKYAEHFEVKISDDDE
jgi:hypothetical protein